MPESPSTKNKDGTPNNETLGIFISEDGSCKVKQVEWHVAPSALEFFITEGRAWDSAEDFPEVMIIFSE